MFIRLAVLLFLLVPVTVSAAEYELFSTPNNSIGSLNAESLRGNPQFESALRVREVRLLPQSQSIGTLDKGDTLFLELFPGDSFTATIDRISSNTLGVTSVRARLAIHKNAYLLLVSKDGKSQGSVVIPEQGKRYHIVYDNGSQRHFLLEVDPGKLDKLPESPSVIPPQEESESPQSRIMMEEAAAFAQATIDVLIVYTSAANRWADDYGGSIDLVVSQAMDRAQLVHDNSNTLVTLRLVHSEEVNYIESGSSLTDLSRLQDSVDGYLDTVHNLRDRHGADVVVMMTKIDDTGGIGYLLTSISGSPHYAFSITRVQQAAWTYTTAHEIGHNLGLHHHKEQNFQPGPGLFSYSAGWRWTGNDQGKYCSIMTYQDGFYFSDGVTHSQVAYFSSPLTSYQGVVTGDATNGDNARNVREIKHVVAAYRDEVFASIAPILQLLE